MGEMAEYYLEQEDPFEPDETYWRGGKPEPEDWGVPPLVEPRPKPTATIWVTREGERVAVRGMDNQHLVNTIRMLRRNAPKMMAAEELSLYAYLDSDPPDGAYDCASGALSELDEMDADEFLEATVPTFVALLAEAEKRGLAP